MRIDTKLNALELVAKNGVFSFDTERIMNDQHVKILNWGDARVALQVLQDIEFLPNDRNSQLIGDYLENRGESDVLEVPLQHFQALQQAVQRYNNALNIVISTLRAHTVSSSPETIWVEVTSASNPSELANITREIERALKIAGQAGASFRFVGVAQGSDWFGFMTESPLAGIALNYCINLAASISMELMKVTGPVLHAFVTLDDDSEEGPRQEDIDSRIASIKDRVTDVMIDQGVEQFVEHLKNARYQPESRNQVGASIRATTKTIKHMAESDQARFEVSESGKGIVVGIFGNNNQVTIQQFPNIPAQKDALPPGENE